MKKRDGDGPGEIDLTPMLDVVFILLIFFIVTSVFVTEAGIDVSTLGGFGLSWSMFYDGIGEGDYESWGGRARVSVKF